MCRQAHAHKAVKGRCMHYPVTPVHHSSPVCPVQRLLTAHYTLSRKKVVVRKRKKKTFVYTPNLTVVNKTTLAYTAVYNATTHSEWFILINLD